MNSASKNAFFTIFLPWLIGECIGAAQVAIASNPAQMDEQEGIFCNFFY